ncbi:MAG TPA: DUF4129 domain-containing protein [Candidatus Polarisedimenticolia bacterium]|nr:DUF4129 domain-containing protein [Candidatus Polarisedimenticolia bacterium]
MRWPKSGAACALAALLLAPLIPQAAEQKGVTVAVDLAGYISALKEIGSVLDDPIPQRAAIESHLHSLPSAWVVTHQGWTFDVGTAQLGADLAKVWDAPTAAEPAARLKVRLTTMIDEAMALENGRWRDTGPARAELTEILSRQEFGGAASNRWMDQLVRRINEAVKDLLDAVFGKRSTPEPLMEALAWIGLAAIFCVAAVWVLRVVARPSAQLSTRFQTAGGAITPIQEWAHQARTAAARGDFREAVRCAYWAAVHGMAERGAWTLDVARTHREYLRLLPPRHEMASPMTEITHRFEKVWYAGGEDTEVEVEFHDTVAQMERLGCPLRLEQGTKRS